MVPTLGKQYENSREGFFDPAITVLICYTKQLKRRKFYLPLRYSLHFCLRRKEDGKCIKKGKLPW